MRERGYGTKREREREWYERQRERGGMRGKERERGYERQREREGV